MDLSQQIPAKGDHNYHVIQGNLTGTSALRKRPNDTDGDSPESSLTPAKVPAGANDAMDQGFTEGDLEGFILVEHRRQRTSGVPVLLTPADKAHRLQQQNPLILSTQVNTAAGGPIIRHRFTARGGLLVEVADATSVNKLLQVRCLGDIPIQVTIPIAYLQNYGLIKAVPTWYTDAELRDYLEPEDHGSVFSCGDNKMGQCGVGSQNQSIHVPTRVVFKVRPVVRVSCGGEFSVMVDCKGAVYTFGCPEYGQLGHNTDGRYFVTSNKLQFKCELVPRRVQIFIDKTREGHVVPVDDVNIVDVASGLNHTIALDRRKRCFSWGFGGYGRLGHNEPKDEMVPRMIKAFDGPNRGLRVIFAGGTFSMALSELGVLYFWGMNNHGGEATMYPKPIQDLTGWNVRDIGCSNKSIVVLADESTISWGPHPTYGELGYGEGRQKSSTTPQEVRLLEGIHIHTVACGLGHSVFIARDDTEEERARIRKLPEFVP
ncbi:protein RCC2 homolog isoform X2 [Ixodes scapularis]